MSAPDRTVEISEEAIEAAAESLWNEREYRDPSRVVDSFDPERTTREPLLWAEMVERGKYAGDQRDYRSDARAVLLAAAPIFAAPLLRELEEVAGQIATLDRDLTAARHALAASEDRADRLLRELEEAKDNRDGWERRFHEARDDQAKLVGRLNVAGSARTSAEARADQLQQQLEEVRKLAGGLHIESALQAVRGLRDTSEARLRQYNEAIEREQAATRQLDAARRALGEIAGVWGEPDQLDWNARAMRRAAREVLATLHAPDGTEGGGS